MSLATRDIMDGMFEAYLEAAMDPDDIPHTDEPVWILGKKYKAQNELNEIRQDISSKIWITYRKNFIPIGGSEGLTSDKGWGCMLRCGQMVLAQALVWAHLGRDWVWTPDTKDPTYLKILQKFEEKRSAPFSIHQIAAMGASEGKQVGQWFGPNTVAQVLKKLVIFDEWCNLEIHVALDNCIIISDIKAACAPNHQWKPLLLIVPLRLGLSEINPIYIGGIQKCFQFRQSLGVIGGKPNLALYFIGCVGNEVIYLDPHTTQKAGFVGNKETDDNFEVDFSYHCKFAARINILSMDPSVAVEHGNDRTQPYWQISHKQKQHGGECFFCKTEQDFNELCQNIKKDLIDPEKQPLFEVSYEKPKEWCPSSSISTSRDARSLIGRSESEKSLDSDEFEIL